MLDTQAGMIDLVLKTAKEADILDRLIKGKQLQEREEYFWNNARLYCCAAEEESYDLARQLKNQLGYFQHCFLKDSKLHKELLDPCHLRYLLNSRPEET